MRGCRPLTQDEASRVLAEFQGTNVLRNRALFLLGTKSGFRISELLSLRLGDILQHGQIVDRVSVARRYMKKQREGRTILLHPEAKLALWAWIPVLRDRGYMTAESFVFQSMAGGNRPISRITAYRILIRAFRNNRLTGKLGTHSMRKTFATHVYEKLGWDLLKTQRALGHKDIRSTVSYLTFREEDVDEAILSI